MPLSRSVSARKYSTIVVGAGAAGFFAAITARTFFPHQSVLLLEKNRQVLSKVRISGGGRCNVTHACFDPALLSQYYPRGGKELRQAFHYFQPKETMAWFEKEGVALKIEEDGRVFPCSDSSETIIRCLMDKATHIGVDLLVGMPIKKISQEFEVECESACFSTDKLILATGSAPFGYDVAREFGHTIIDPVPSLFTLNILDHPLSELSGITVQDVELECGGVVQQGPLLITHFGFSGPAALKLSAWAARKLHACNYKAPLAVRWVALPLEEIYRLLLITKEKEGKKLISSTPLFHLPRALWQKLLLTHSQEKWHALSHKTVRGIAEKLYKDIYQIESKTTYKQEFVTAGGVALEEVNFKTMESKLKPHLHFAGEILNVDGVTGGFNFQNAWTSGFLSASQSS